MKSSRKLALALLLLTLAAHAELSSWVRFVESGSTVEQAFFRLMPLPGGQVMHRRPPAESQAELAKLIAASPAQADLHALRALESERLLDFPSAEADWKKHVELSADKYAANLALADYHHRRLNTAQEMQALRAAAKEKPDFERMLALANAQLLPVDQFEAIYLQWREKLPQTQEPWENGVRYLASVKQFDKAAAWIAEYARQFPGDPAFALGARADLEKAKGNTRAALDIYDRAFDPLWPHPLMAGYFTLLRETRTTRQFLTNARGAAQANPVSLEPAARIYHYYTQEGNRAAGIRALTEFQRRKESLKSQWTAAELATLAQLWQQAGNATESARAYYALYSLNGGEDALAGLIDLLMSGPHYLALGAGDLTFYKDIATADSGPGLLNGILSLLLNSSVPDSRFSSLERNSTAYFERSRAAELISLFDQRFPSSRRRANMRAQLIQAYATHGETEAVIRAGGAFLAAFADSPQRTMVTLLMADAHASRSQTAQEFAAYDRLLAELVKSPEYARILDRYVARLVALKRPREALVLMRREIDRNPNDPLLYERLAAFLEQNKMAAAIEQVYRQAAQQFPDRSWHHKLARHYMRGKQLAQFQQLTGDVAKIFSGADLEKYFNEVVATGSLDAQLYRQVNLYASQRFPHNLTFVRNLLTAYQTRGTADPVAYENLLRRHWYYDDGLRSRFFEHLSRTGKLTAELQAVKSETNPAATRMLAEAEAWRCHFEDAAAPLARVFDDAPGDTETGRRATLLHRSLGTARTDSFASRLHTAAPRDWYAITTIGEIEMERSPSAGAAIFRRIAEIDPGSAEGYLQAATLHWDYFEYDNALDMIERGRKALNKPALHAYEAGAVYENKREYGKAIEEYRKGAMAEPGPSAAQSRLLALARRPPLRQVIDSATSNLGAEGLALRIALLEEQQRKSDIEALLDGMARSTDRFEILTRVGDESRRLGFANVEERALRREIELTPDPVDKLRLRLNLARVLERRKDFAQAAQTIDSLYRENPSALGIVRAAVDYHWRNRNNARALEILTAASNAAHPSLRGGFTFEYARKATESGQYAAARQSLERLLSADPRNAAYIGAIADTYAREGNDAALKAFYQEQIKAMGANAAPLRRALAGVLTRTKDYAGALDQYIEVLNRYPEDGALTAEVAAHARRFQLEPKLVGAYQKTVTDSPRDYRYYLVLARVHTALEDFPNAIAAYTKASQVRPDRADLLEARAVLEERLMRFDDAAQSFTTLYELTYNSSVWIERVAELRARQRRADDCVAALRKAHPDTAQGNFDIARRLESWDLLEQARTFADRGVELAGAQLVTDYFSGAETYARILARQRQYQSVDRRLLPAVASVAAVHFTLEEKRQLGVFFNLVNAGPELGRRAGMAEWEARKLHQEMLAKPGAESQPLQARLIELQQQRVAHRELGAQLEAYWMIYPPQDEKPSILDAAADAYAAVGDDASELRTRRGRRRLELLALHNPKLLIADGTDDAVNVAIESGKADLAMAAVAARHGAPPVWTRSYTALAGVYFDLRTPAIEQAFQGALGSMRLGDRLGRPTDRDEHLVTGDWFYSAARYGEYLASDDFLPAALEESPGDDDRYFELAEYYRGKGRNLQAMADYEHALQLNPRHVGAINRSAQLLMADGKRDLAMARWRLALDTVVAEAAARGRPFSLGSDLDAVLEQLAAHRVLSGLRGEAERAVAALLRRQLFGEAFVKTLALASESPEGVIVALSSQIPAPVPFLGRAVEYEWLNAAQRDAVYQRLLELSRARADTEYHARLQQWLESLIQSGQTARARSAITSLSETDRQRLSYWLPKAEMLLAAKAGTIASLVQGWGQESGKAPSADYIREAAAQLRNSGDGADARRLLRFLYERDLNGGARDAATFLGYAGVLLEAADTQAAVRTLRRMTLVTDPPFANHVHAGRLLARHGKAREAAVFLDEAVRATPWDREAAARSKPQGTTPTTLQAAWTAVRNDPGNTALKLDLFAAARAAGSHFLAVAALTNIDLTEEQRAIVARDLADSYARTDRLEIAIATLSAVPHDKAQVARWKAELKRRQLNRERMPVASQNLKQDRVVRAMLAAGGVR